MAPPLAHSLPRATPALYHGPRLPAHRGGCFAGQGSLGAGAVSETGKWSEAGAEDTQSNNQCRGEEGSHPATCLLAGPRLSVLVVFRAGAHRGCAECSSGGSPPPLPPRAWPRGRAQAPAPARKGPWQLPRPGGGLDDIYSAQRTWEWRGHSVNYSVLGPSGATVGGSEGGRRVGGGSGARLRGFHWALAQVRAHVRRGHSHTQPVQKFKKIQSI